MADITCSMPLRHVMRDTTMTVEITGTRAFAVRQWIAVRLMALAAVVLGCGIEVNLNASSR